MYTWSLFLLYRPTYTSEGTLYGTSHIPTLLTQGPRLASIGNDEGPSMQILVCGARCSYRSVMWAADLMGARGQAGA